MRASQAFKALTLAASVAWIVGCSSPNTVSEEGTAGAGSQSGADVYGAGNGAGVNGSSMGGDIDVANLKTIFYFDFDEASVRGDSVADLEAHAQYLASHPSAAVRLEGHADERGTREYNMALGERRAKAIERFLTINGVAASQVETISYGEEKPVVMGSSDSSWAQNRRVELKYTSR
jgi:peptidoglycan-associated lipoprotein